MKNHPPFFIVFEGLDGSGKSTCARLAAQALNACYMTTPSAPMRQYRETILAELGDSQEARQLFYLATVFAASREIEQLLHSGCSVVLDRYFLSTQAYAEFRGSVLTLDHLQRHLRPADITVFLDAPLATRRGRIAERGGNAADRETLGDLADARLRKAHLRRSCLPVVGRFLAIDSSLASPEQVVVRVQNEIRDLHSRN